LGGIVALSTYLTLQDSLVEEGAPANRATPIFMGHGTQDPVVPLALAEASAATLRTLGYAVEWHAWPMPHSVCAEEVQLLAEFFVRIYGTGRTETSRSAI